MKRDKLKILAVHLQSIDGRDYDERNDFTLVGGPGRMCMQVISLMHESYPKSGQYFEDWYKQSGIKDPVQEAGRLTGLAPEVATEFFGYNKQLSIEQAIKAIEKLRAGGGICFPPEATPPSEVRKKLQEQVERRAKMEGRELKAEEKLDFNDDDEEAARREQQRQEEQEQQEEAEEAEEAEQADDPADDADKEEDDIPAQPASAQVVAEDKEHQVSIPASQAPVEYVFEGDQEKMLAIAISKGDLDTVKLIHGLYKEERADQRRVLFQENFAKAQGEFGDFTKNNKANINGATYAYADLGEVFRVVRGPLNKYGIGIRIVDEEKQEAGYFTARCEIFGHGHMIVNRFTVKLDIMKGSFANDAQKKGAAATYANRYAAYGALGIFPSSEDVDGNTNGSSNGNSNSNSAAQKAATQRKKNFAPVLTTKRLIAAAESMLQGHIKGDGILTDDENKWFEEFVKKWEGVEELPPLSTAHKPP